MTSRGSSPSDQEERLQAISHSVRGTFYTVEDMTQSFIREAILQGVFLPGERLNLDVIARALGVSRMPVRAGLRQLESEGLVRIYPHRGAMVSILRADEIAELYELRILLEGYLIDRALPNLTDDMLERMRGTVEKLEESQNLAERLELRKEFYELFYSLANRPRALSEAKTLRAAVGRYLLLRRIEEQGGHPGLLQYLEARDAKGAKRWIAKHLTRVSRELQQLVAKDEASA